MTGFWLIDKGGGHLKKYTCIGVSERATFPSNLLTCGNGASVVLMRKGTLAKFVQGSPKAFNQTDNAPGAFATLSLQMSNVGAFVYDDNNLLDSFNILCTQSHP